MVSNVSQQAAISRMRSLMPVTSLLKADRIAKINSRYIGMDRDVDLRDAIDSMIASVGVVNLSEAAKPDKRRIVAITGESGAGKSTALFEHTSRREVMLPYIDEEGNEVSPLLPFDAPPGGTSNDIAYEGLRVLGYPIKTHQHIWSVFQNALRANKVHWIRIDEAQHAIDTANVKQRVTIANALKTLVQMPDWPVRIILAGVEPLAEFMSVPQLSNRKTVVPFEKLSGKNGLETALGLLQLIVFDHASMATDLVSDPDFLMRLLHASDNEFGNTIKNIRSAIELAILADEQCVKLEHFSRAYKTYSGCLEDENIFTANEFLTLSPHTAAMRDADRRWLANRNNRQRQK